MRLVIDPRARLTDVAQESDVAIDVRSISKTYGRIKAVDDLSFDVSWGSVTGLLGTDGAGKTTALRILLGLTAPSAGSATIAGLPFHLHRRPALHVGAALGANSFHPEWTPRKQLRLMIAAAKLDRARIDVVLERTGLTAVADTPVGRLDHGMRQRVAVAVALLGDPRVLILDDPMEGLAAEARAWLRGLLRDHAAGGGAVLMTAKRLGDLAGIADEMLMLERGALVARGSINDGIAAPAADVFGMAGEQLVAS